MAKFVIECPKCGKYTEASTGFFAKKKIDCVCGYTINIKTDKMASKECPHCGNTVIYDQSKGDKALCPVCHNSVNTTDDMRNLVEFTCPSCSCKLSVDKNAESYTCPLCETHIDVQNRIAKEKVKNAGLASVIKYEGGNDMFVWKHPIEDFNLGSQLIVHESQEALFFKDGRALDLFGAGRYTLATQNLPILEELYRLPFNPKDVFHSEVYFINKTTQMGIKWGTNDKVEFLDPASGIPLKIGACGTFNLRVSDSRKFLLKVVGTTGEFSQSEVIGEEDSTSSYSTQNMVGKFKSLVMNRVKSNLVRAIKELKINFIDIDEYLDVLSERMKNVINENLDGYGLFMPEFFITTILKPDDANYKRYTQQFAEKTLIVREEEIRKAELDASEERIIKEAELKRKLKEIEAHSAADALKIKGQAKVDVYKMGAEAKADAYKMKAFAEAAEMQAKGYTYQQETARQVSLEAMKNGITGNGSAGGAAMEAMGDIAGLGVSLGAMSGVMNMTKDALNPVMNGAKEMGAGFGEMIAGNVPKGNQVNVQSQAEFWNCVCGEQGISSKFCPECGAKKPEPKETWDCACGEKGISSKFCPECGAKKPEPKETWDCACGAKGIDSKFCPQCGTKKGE